MGCTIGSVRNSKGEIFIFKNRDLLSKKENPEPLITKGKYKYIKFGLDVKEQIPGIWAGINENGVSVVGADGNSFLNFQGDKFGPGELTWVAYELVASEAESVEDAYKIIIDFYTSNNIGGSGDIILIADRKKTMVIEYILNLWSLRFFTDTSYTVRTNFFVNMPHLRPIPEESTLHLSSDSRYIRAMELISKTGTDTELDDIKNICRDHGKGKSAFSICRHGGEGEYRTYCSVIFALQKEKINCWYIVDGFPCENKYKLLEMNLTKSHK